jgi:hypothetical protein
MHLSSDVLVDLAERTLDASQVPHLRTCEHCRQQVEELRAAMCIAAEADVPEPSPLFWPHLSGRVHEAVSGEPMPADAGRFVWIRMPRAIPVALATFAALVVAIVVVSRFSVPGPQTPPAPAVDSALSVDALPEDPALTLVADLASTMNYDEASEIEISTHAGSVDEAVSSLSAGERQELRRLLTEALRQGGD